MLAIFLADANHPIVYTKYNNINNGNRKQQASRFAAILST